MKRLLALLLCLAAWPAFAAPASAESVEELLHWTRAEKMLFQAYEALDDAISADIHQKFAQGQLTAREHAAQELALHRFMQDFRRQNSWQRLRPAYVQMYRDTFDQTEVEALIAFYRSAGGQAFVDKMPLLLQRSMGLVHQLLAQAQPQLELALRQAREDRTRTP